MKRDSHKKSGDINLLDSVNSNNNAYDRRLSEKTQIQNTNNIPKNNNNKINNNNDNGYNLRGKSNELTEIFQELKVKKILI